MESSRSRDQTCVPCIGRQILIHCATREVLQIFKVFVLSISWAIPQSFYSITVATVTFGKIKPISTLLQLLLAFWAWTCLTLDLWCLWSSTWYPCMRRAGRSASYRVNFELVQDWTQWVNACSSAPSSWQFRGASTWSSDSDSKTKPLPPTALTCPKMHPYFGSPFSPIAFFPAFTHDSLKWHSLVNYLHERWVSDCFLVGTQAKTVSLRPNK